MAIGMSLLIWFVASFFVYRILTNGSQKTLSGEMHYKFLEIGLTNRDFFEELLKNRPVRIEGQPLLYVSNDDYLKLWPENPFDMANRHYTIEADLISQPLLIGGYSTAKVIKVIRVNKDPIITK